MIASLPQPVRSSPEDQPSDRIGLGGRLSSLKNASMKEVSAEDEEQHEWKATDISAGQRMLSAVSGSILTSLLGGSRAYRQ